MYPNMKKIEHRCTSWNWSGNQKKLKKQHTKKKVMVVVKQQYQTKKWLHLELRKEEMHKSMRL
jgi:hypothetical protein